mmetsp:Transcript_30279/g.76922  ORF Transcript_30279/g.76922 Transcript_30279/m.76922 type:complete len:211 (+) Transcript_30279:45-677(+)
MALARTTVKLAARAPALLRTDSQRTDDSQATLVTPTYSSFSCSSTCWSRSSSSARDTARFIALQSPAPELRVKHTFINGYDGDGEEDLISFTRRTCRTRTCPARLLEESLSEIKSEQCSKGSTEGGIPPLGVRQAKESVGSAGHASKQCKPCGWYWQAQGCRNQEQCQHCHLCFPSDLKLRRKRELKARAKSLRQQRQACAGWAGAACRR